MVRVSSIWGWCMCMLSVISARSPGGDGFVQRRHLGVSGAPCAWHCGGRHAQLGQVTAEGTHGGVMASIAPVADGTPLTHVREPASPVGSDRRVPVRPPRATVTRPRPQVGCVPRSAHTHISSSLDHVDWRVVCGRLDCARKGFVGCALYRVSQRESVERWMPQCAQVALPSSPWAKYQSIHCRRCRVVGWGMAITSRQAKCRRCL